MNLCLVMPAYNESGCIVDVVEKWTKFLAKKFADEAVMIVVNDGSKDNTGQLLEQLSTKIPHLKVVHQANGGHGAAVLNGYKKAIELNPEWVFQTDSDDQFKPEDFDKLWEKRNDSLFITGYRQVRHDPLHRLVITRIVRTLLLLLFGVPLFDSNVPYRLMQGRFLKALLKELPGYVFAPNIFLALLARASGQNLFEVPIQHEERKTGTISIIKWKLLKVCFRSAKELALFRLGFCDSVRRVKAEISQ